MEPMLRASFVWYQAHKEPFELFALALSLFGIIFAVQSIGDGRKMLRDVRSVFDHLTTRGLGPYPTYLNEVERLIGEARDSIFVACDFPGYGVWSDRGRYSGYLKALEDRKADRVRRSQSFKIQIVCLDKDSRQHELEERFPEGSWKEYVKKGGFARSRRLYEELESSAVPETRTAFLADMGARQERAITAELRFADVRELSGMMPVHFWIADEKRAVFVIPGGEGGDYGFVTEEIGLVQGLLAIFDRYREAAAGQPAARVVSRGPRAVTNE
jgi:hypothetical protein